VQSSLVIRLPATDDAPVEWVAVDNGGADIGTPEQGQLAEAVPHAEHRKLIVLVPASKVLRLNAKIPLKGNARIRQALPFALEEQLAGDIDKQHFAFSKKDEKGQLPVAVVSRVQLRHWLEILHQHQLVPAAIYSESDALTVAPATTRVLLGNNQVIISDPAGEITVADASAMETLLELFLDHQETALENDATVAPVSLIIYCNQAIYDQHHSLWDRLQMRTENIEVKLLADGALPYLAHQITTQANVNLLQGAFAPKTELPFEWQQWRTAAILLVSFLGLNLVYKGVEYWQLSNADAALDAAAAEVLSTTFPGVGTVPDPWNELRSRLGASGSGTDDNEDSTDFAEALEVLSNAFAQVPGLSMETLSFRSGSLDLQLIAPDVAALDRLRQLISDPGQFSAEIQSANPSDEVIEGRINIKRAETS